MGAGYSIEIAPTGYASLRAIRDKKVLREILEGIEALALRPDSQRGAAATKEAYEETKKPGGAQDMRDSWLPGFLMENLRGVRRSGTLVVQGKALLHPFEGIRSLRAIRSRYRILYQVDSNGRRVSVLLVGERRPGEERDVYAIARRLLKTLRGDKID